MASRRKHLVHAQQDLTLQDNQSIVRVVAPKGGNVFEVVFPTTSATTLVSLPSRFNKLLYVKRGGYLIVETSSEATGAVTGFVVAVLYEDDVKALRRQGNWPPEFDDRGPRPDRHHLEEQEEEDDNSEEEE